ncbi:hypothetical protein Ahy_B04g070759 isoform B [Arachis hypogaea]|uniref:Alpha 1,4-glycosyltransferase domain-containing protein n=1 Tax=Arachis hypogaea TaxID=3818 RepID=A0A444ZIS9_ARAHY|nr:hypothetical protein Ahy_B04g070759 isoform B [Arachis hypogaea]
MLRSRRRSPYAAYLCAVISALLLLLSVSLLYSRLSLTHPHSSHLRRTPPSPSLLSDSTPDDLSSDDPIDELDFDDQNPDPSLDTTDPLSSAGYFYDPLSASLRRSFKTPRNIHQFSDPQTHNHILHFATVGYGRDDRAKAAFGSDDLPVDDDVRRLAAQVTAIEDALLIRSTSPLRKGWGDWFEKKSVFLRKDRMFRSNFEVLNPNNNPLLQDPDGVGASGFTRGDRIVQKLWLNEFKKAPPLTSKKVLLSINNNKNYNNVDSLKSDRRELRTNRVSGGIKGGAERRTLNDGNESIEEHGSDVGGDLTGKVLSVTASNSRKGKSVDFGRDHVYADDKTWGYYPGLPLNLSFTKFMEAFFGKGKCSMRVFMVWNSPPWMYSVRHQRGLESLLFHHPEACVVIFSETMELDFFKDTFVKDGYKVTIVMPNLDELLKGTPAHIFSSVWFEWRKTKFYATHYSELIRLVALYRYGGIYLDSDIIVLKPIYFLNNSLGMEDDLEAEKALNGAVMAFEKHRYSRNEHPKSCGHACFETYDDTSLRGNGADLLTRVAKQFLGKENKSVKQLELKVEPSYIFFPISLQDITRFFSAPETETQKAWQDALLESILHKSLTFHFWNHLTYALIPEPNSLVNRLMNRACLRCSELL